METDMAGGSGSSEGDAVETTIGASFRVKYLGSSLVDCPNGQVATADAIKTVIALSKASGKKLQRVTLNVSLRGIKVIDWATNETQFDISIYRISYCSSDAAFTRVFAFIATNLNETMECHAFLCRKRKLARSATLAIARTFNTAYELWQLSNEASPAEEPPITVELPDLPEKEDLSDDDEEENEDDQLNINAPPVEEKKVIPDDSPLIDFNNEVDLPKKDNPWVQFDDDELNSPMKRLSIIIPEGDDLDVDWGETNGASDLLCLP